MKQHTLLLITIVLFFACKDTPIIDNNNPFKYGVFEIPAGNGYSKTIITRLDSLQIERYTKMVRSQNDTVARRVEQIDTLYIKWKNNFSYTLRMKRPKNKLDKEPIFVNINKVTANSYDFTAQIGFSNFKQKGTVTKVEN